MRTTIIALILLSTPVAAETVDVKYRGPVDLKPFACEEYTRSSLVKRVCYDEAKKYMLILLNRTWYHSCAIDAQTVASLKSADSMGRFYNGNIKGNFDCRVNAPPSY